MHAHSRSTHPLRNHSLFTVCAATLTFVGLLTGAARAAVVTVPYKGPRQIEEIQARGIEIIAGTKYGIDVEADGANLDWLMSRPYPVSVTELGPRTRTTFALDGDLGQYHTYAETESLLSILILTYPAIADTIHIGKSIQNRNVTVLKVSDNVGVDENEPEILYMGNHHARELMSVEIPLRFAEYILARYGVDATITNYINTREIFFIPTVNPDGLHYVQGHHAGSSNSWWRKNRRLNAGGTFGVDLNRNYAYQWGYDNVGSSPTPSSDIYRGTAAFSEPETQAIRNFANSRHFTTWLSYHSYGELLLYPWGYFYGNTPDHQAYATFADTLAKGTGYVTGNPASGAIYITNGDSDDWGYGEQGTKDKIFAYTPEVNSLAQGGFGPAESLIQPTFDLLLPMNLKLLEWGDNPYRVLGPYPPAQYAVQAPYANAINRITWTPDDPADPNPIVSYEIEGCLNPTQFIDACTPALTGWTPNGFSYTLSGFLGGGYSSGAGDGLANTLVMGRPFVVDASTDSLRFKVTYDIETDYDYGYVDVSTDGGFSWTTVAGNITTTFNPFGANRGHGFTGTSPGWVSAIFPLTGYLGQEIMLRIAYITDGAVAGTGFRIDNIENVVSCGSVSIVASAVTDTLYDHLSSSAGTWRYRVRAIDAESQPSPWSNARDGVVATLTGVDEPRVFRTDLGANYPNPFNPATRIPYVVGGAVQGRPVAVELAVFSVTGARVATLVNEARAPGTYVSRWDGRDGQGRPVSSGIYFARLTVDGASTHVRKLVLLK